MLYQKNVVVRAVSCLLPGILIAFPLFPARGQVVQTNTVVRVMAANITGNSQQYEDFGIRILQGLKADVVAIQEFNYYNNTAADIRSMVDTAFGTNFVYFRENYTGSGDIPNGIISRYPIITAGSWTDTQMSSPNRGFAWAQLDVPGTNDLYVVSVHLLTSSATARANEAANLKALIQANFPANAWILVAGDFNTDSRTESAMVTFDSFLSDYPIPTDAEAGGNSNTSVNRNHPHDYVLPSFNFTNLETASVFPSHSFSNGLVFDSRVYTPLSDVPPVLYGDSSNAQHMAVLKDFRISYTITNPPTDAPVITNSPQSQSVDLGNDATFTVGATGVQPLAYQWYFTNSAIADATASSYTRTNVQPADAGNYFVVVTNTAGSATSAVATLTVNAAPIITGQPTNQSVWAGQNATFAVTATGAGLLSYQWRFNGTSLAAATASAFTRTNAQLADAGNYTVVITNTLGAVTSAGAALTVTVQPGSVIAQWNFNSSPADGSTTTGTAAPSVGPGTATLVGGTHQAFANGSLTDPASTDNSGWNIDNFPTQGTANTNAGVQFNVSTAGRQSIVIRWDQRVSNTGSKYVRLLYTTNGTAFIAFPSTTVETAESTFEPKTNILAGFAGVDNNPNFAFRIVAEFESTATGSGSASYVAAKSGSSYATTGTIRFDMLTVSGAVIPPPTPAAAPQLGSPAFNANTQFVFTVTGTATSNYIVQATTNLSAGNWVSLRTNPAPFTFVDTNANGLPQRFYRGLVGP